MTKKLTKEEFVERANKAHDNKYDYSKFECLGDAIKSTIICPEHGEFQKLPGHHMRGQGCKKCSMKMQSRRFIKSKEEFIAQANKVHSHKYDYSEFEYINEGTKSTIICNEHSKFRQAPTHHLNGIGCPKCGTERGAKKIRKSKEQFVIDANIVHNNKYNYSKLIYINDKTKVIIICPSHGEFEQEASNHLAGNGCPKCGIVISKAETEWLDCLMIPAKYRNKFIRVNDTRVQPDAMVGNSMFEFYGDYWHGNPNVYKGAKANEIHHRMKISYKQVYEKTKRRENIIKNAGYNLVVIWENDWNIFKKSKLDLQNSSNETSIESIAIQKSIEIDEIVKKQNG